MLVFPLTIAQKTAMLSDTILYSNYIERRKHLVGFFLSTTLLNSKFELWSILRVDGIFLMMADIALKYSVWTALFHPLMAFLCLLETQSEELVGQSD